MKNNIINILDEIQTQFFKNFFRNAPETLISSIIIKRYPVNHKLISADDSCSYVYILLKGLLQGIEENLSNEPYHFMEFYPIEIMGDYELFTHDTVRMITITTIEPSLFLVIPAADYIKWIKNDSNALFIRTQMLIKNLVAQSQDERKLHFLDNRSKLLHFLYNQYKHNAIPSKEYRIIYTRPELANKLGCSIRTINRSIDILKNENLISIKHGKIYISLKQYENIKSLGLEFIH